jgi:hypothetical protein
VQNPSRTGGTDDNEAMGEEKLFRDWPQKFSHSQNSDGEVDLLVTGANFSIIKKGGSY